MLKVENSKKLLCSICAQAVFGANYGYEEDRKCDYVLYSEILLLML